MIDSLLHTAICVVILALMCLATAAPCFAQPANSGPAPGSSARYAPPESTFNAGNQLQVLQVEIDQKNLADAARRLDALLRDSGDALMNAGDDGTERSVSSWVDDLSAEQKKLLVPAFETLAGRAAAQELEDLRGQRAAEPVDYYQIARRYPFTSAASSALAAAAKRAAALGDVPTAHWMIDAALSHGWAEDEAFKRSIETSTATRGNAYRGPLPFEATWFGGSMRETWTSMRSFPTVAGGVIFIVAPGQVVALKETGALLWQGPAGAQPPAGKGMPLPEGTTRGPAFAAGVLCDASDTPRVLIARQPEVHGDGWALRALRAGDGKLLWTTEGRDQYHGLVFASNAAVDGRYVYAIAVDPGEQIDRLYLLAIEVTTGRQLWQSNLGTETRSRPQRGNGQPLPEPFRPWMNQSAPKVSGELVIAAPNVGAVLAVGRFDGKVRWVHPYTTLGNPREMGPVHPGLRTLLNARGPPPRFRQVQPGLSLRYSNTPDVTGEMVVVAPSDSDSAMGLDARSGKLTWTDTGAMSSPARAAVPGLADATLVGIRGSIAVFAGETLWGIDAGSGQVAWMSQAMRDVIDGPAVLSGDVLYVPATTGIMTLSAQTGLATPPAAKMPSFRVVLGMDPARAALSSVDVIGCFVRPEAVR